MESERGQEGWNVGLDTTSLLCHIRFDEGWAQKRTHFPLRMLVPEEAFGAGYFTSVIFPVAVIDRWAMLAVTR